MAAKKKKGAKNSASKAKVATARERLDDAELIRMLAQDGSLLPGAEPQISDETLLHVHDVMALMRALDDRMVKLQRQGRVGFYGTCQGEEATVLGVSAALETSDWVVPALRQGAAMLYRGFPLVPYVAQVFGNSGDITKARQMPSHQAGRSVNCVSWGSCIANQLPQAVGMAKASQLRGDNAVVVGFIGDGGTSEGDFHSAMNMAALWKVPLILVCQNNQWAISTPLEVQSRVTRIVDKAPAYGIRGERVDGNDLLAVHSVISDAAARARAGEGPTFVEALTYRIGAHSTSDDPSRYRDETVTDAWRERDPVERVERLLVSRGLRDEAGLAAAHAAGFEKVDAAVKEVESLPPMAHESLIEDVCREVPAELKRQWDEWNHFPPAAAH